ncbi:hypothetical protein [Paenibacillus hamazuiensis]|uniref:hypothetical protein n=1 Tax=Paenibacillus hamazuiensis TaxID=2936508 RepID=UPI00200C358E|nr:hypothetical protein [Paenibacillus hamazuiensis]
MALTSTKKRPKRKKRAVRGKIARSGAKPRKKKHAAGKGASSYQAKFNKGYDEGYNQGFDIGYAEGYEKGHELAYNKIDP